MLRTAAIAAMLGAIVLSSASSRADESPVVDARSTATASVGNGTHPVDTPFGLYPLWEHTAGLLPSGAFQIGYARSAVAFGPVQIGTQPLLDAYGTWNADLKLRLWRTAHTRGAFVVGAHRVPTRAEARTFGNLDAAGFTNPYGPVWLVPVSFVTSVALSSRAALHLASTALVVHGERDPQRNLSAGQTLLLEARPSAASGWIARLHTGVVGVAVDAQAHAGLSVGHDGDVLRWSLGVARRFPFSGVATTVMMLDAAVMFR